MMKQAILLSAFSFGSGLLAAENLLTNADFDEGIKGWWSSVSAAMKAAGRRQGIEKDRWVAVIPDTATLEDGPTPFFELVRAK